MGISSVAAGAAGACADMRCLPRLRSHDEADVTRLRSGMVLLQLPLLLLLRVLWEEENGAVGGVVVATFTTA